MANDLPPIPGPSRSLYRAGRRPRFGRGRSSSRSFDRGRSAGGRRWPKRVALALALLVAVAVLGSIAGYLLIDSELGAITRVAVSGLVPAKSGQPLDVLLVGSDSRQCETTAAQAAAFGSKTTQTGQRSDTIIVARFLTNGDVEMLSIPRDTYVPIAGAGGSAKINSAFNDGATGLVETIERNFQIPINHVVMTNFCAFPAIVNSLGGIYMNFPDPVRDAYTGLDVTTTGCQLVDGSEALALVRSRHLYYFSDHVWNYDGQSDFSRIKRQQAFFHALLVRIHEVVPNLFRLNDFATAVAGGVAVDSGFSSNAMIALGLAYHSAGSANLYTSLLPTTEAVIDGEDVLLPAPAADHAVISSFLDGEVAAFSSALGVAGPGSARRVTLDASEVVTGNFPEPWNPTSC